MSNLTLPVGERDHILGPIEAPVTLLEYGDYECPHCAHAHPIVKSVLATMGDRVRFVFRNFPLTTMHPHAEGAAEAAEAAGAQNLFWPMHDQLFENQDALNPADFQQYAVDLGLDVSQFSADITTHAYADRVREDFSSGVRSGVNGTPTFFIDGTRYNGSWDADTLRAALEQA